MAKRSLEKGNLPFGCILGDAKGNILLEGENTVITENDRIAHARSTLYTNSRENMRLLP